MYNFLKNAFFLLLTRIIIGINQLLLAFLLSNIAGFDNYGRYKYLVSIFMIFSVFSLPETQRFIIKYININERYFYLIVREKFLFSFVGSIFLLFIFLFTEKKIFLIYSIIYVFYYTSDVIVSYFYGLRFFKKLNLLLVMRSVSQLFMTICVWSISNNIELVVISFLLSYMFINYMFFYFEFFKHGTKYNLKNFLVVEKVFDFKVINKKIIFFSIVAFFNSLTLNLDKILIKHNMNFKYVGIYSMSLVIGLTVNVLIKSAFSVINPYLVKNKIKKQYYLYSFFIGSIIGFFLYYLGFNCIKFFSSNENLLLSFKLSQILFYSIGIYCLYLMYYNTSFYFYKNDEIIILKNDILVSFIIILLMCFITFISLDIKIKIYLFIFLYPMKYLLSIIVLYFLKRVNNG